MDIKNTSNGPIQRLAFLGFREFEEGEAYRGAILVTDDWSKPLEFRCTAPVRPTPLQRTLYGKSLLPHILTELVGLPLINSVKERPQLVLISEEAFFDLRHKLPLPVIRITNGTGKPASGEREGKARSVLLQSASGKFKQVQADAHTKFAADLDLASESLREFFGRWDLSEPFQRMAEGLQYVHDEQVLES